MHISATRRALATTAALALAAVACSDATLAPTPAVRPNAQITGGSGYFQVSGTINGWDLDNMLYNDCTPNQTVEIIGTVYWNGMTQIRDNQALCGTAPSQRTIRIFGQPGAHIIQTATNPDGSSQTNFWIQTDNVTIESLAMTGVDVADSSMNGGNAISIRGSMGVGGSAPTQIRGHVVRNVTLHKWGTTGVDLRFVTGATIEDNTINCGNMGVSIRNDGLPGYNVVQRNTIQGCLYEGVILEGASYDTVRNNTIDCSAAYRSSLCGWGIAMAGRLTIDHGTWNYCGAARSSYNYVYQNNIYGSRIIAPIIMYGNGPAGQNTIRQNGIYRSAGHAIGMADSVQSGRAETAVCGVPITANRVMHGSNVIHDNIIEDVPSNRAGILAGSSSNWIAGNTVRKNVLSYSSQVGIQVEGSYNEMLSNVVSNAQLYAFQVLGRYNKIGTTSNPNGAYYAGSCGVRYYNTSTNTRVNNFLGSATAYCATSSHAIPLH